MSRCTQEPQKEDCIFAYGAITLYGRTFQTVRLTLSYHCFATLLPPSLAAGMLESNCGPTTPSSPCESLGLGCSDFARRYCRNLV